MEALDESCVLGVGVSDGLGEGLAVFVGDGDTVGLGDALVGEVTGAELAEEQMAGLRDTGLGAAGEQLGCGEPLLVWLRGGDALGDGDELIVPDELTPCGWLAFPSGEPGPPCPGFCDDGTSLLVGRRFWRMPGMARIITTATTTAPAVARTGRSQPSLLRSRSGTLAFTAVTADITAGTAAFTAGTVAEAPCRALRVAHPTAAVAAVRADLRATVTAAEIGTVLLRAALTGGIADLRPHRRYLKSIRAAVSQPMSMAKLPWDRCSAILCRIRSSPSADGTTPSAAAFSARRRRSSYSAWGSVMTAAPGRCGARPCRAPCDFSLRPC